MRQPVLGEFIPLLSVEPDGVATISPRVLSVSVLAVNKQKT
jgi:hypothetical protein